MRGLLAELAVVAPGWHFVDLCGTLLTREQVRPQDAGQAELVLRRRRTQGWSAREETGVFPLADHRAAMLDSALTAAGRVSRSRISTGRSSAGRPGRY